MIYTFTVSDFIIGFTGNLSKSIVLNSFEKDLNLIAYLRLLYKRGSQGDPTSQTRLIAIFKILYDTNTYTLSAICEAFKILLNISHDAVILVRDL